jgi:ketosteroid isomerase-like protein
MSQPIDPQFIDRLQAAFREGDKNAAGKALEAENVRVIEGVFRAIARKDFDALGGLLADDATFEMVGSGGPMSARAEGRERVVEAARGNFAQIEDQRPEILSVVAQGDTVVVVGKERGRFRSTGREYEVHWMHQYRLEGGKIVRITELLDSAALLDALKPPGG